MSNCETASYLTTILFTLTYIGLAVGKVPGLAWTEPASPWSGRP